jgi:tryptophanyl-tRNA synthetase
MSKSYGNTIDIFAEGKPLEKTVMSIQTDSTPMGQPLDPGASNVYALSCLFATDAEKAELAAQYRSGTIGFGGAKKLLKDKIDGYFAPFRARRKELAGRLDTVEDILREGAKRARLETQRTMEKVYKATGLR